MIINGTSSGKRKHIESWYSGFIGIIAHIMVLGSFYDYDMGILNRPQHDIGNSILASSFPGLRFRALGLELAICFFCFRV